MLLSLKSRAHAFQANARDVLSSIPEKSIEAASRYLMQRFSTSSVFSTVYTGQRKAEPDAAITADLAILAEAIGPQRLTQEPLLCDWASQEPRMMTIIRQFEGHPSALQAALIIQTDKDAEETIAEVTALGLSLEEQGQCNRQIGLIAPATIAPHGDQALHISAGTSWDDLHDADTAHGFAPVIAGADHFASPIIAAEAGLFDGAEVELRYDRAWRATIPRPPKSHAVSQRVWAFADADTAERAFEYVIRHYKPSFAETIPAMDAQIMELSKLWHGHRRYNDDTSAGLRLCFSGPSISRRAALMEASWHIERMGGISHWRRALPSPAALDCVAVATGFARFEHPASLHLAKKDTMLTANKKIYFGEQVRKHQVSWYIRDLSRSLTQAAEFCGLANPSMLFQQDGDTELAAIMRDVIPENTLHG